MYVVNLSAELFPLAKAGGLGDVLQGLSLELARQNVEVEIILPKYLNLNLSSLKNLKVEYNNIPSFEDSVWHSNTIYTDSVDNIKITLIEDHHPKKYFKREKIYGYNDDTCRFIYFCRAALEYLLHQKRNIDILHLHEWQTSIAAPLYREIFAAYFNIKGIVLTMHNLEHQGRCTTLDLDRIGLKGADFLNPNKMQDDDPEYPNNLNLLKGGIVYSDAITTVSPTYGREILEDKGFWLEKILRKKAYKLHPILNGIDTITFNPELDSLLPIKFARHNSVESIISAKSQNQKILCQKTELTFDNKPLVASIGRLVPQKGPDLIKHAIFQTLRQGGKFILLGSSPIKEIEEEFLNLKEMFKDNKNVSLNFEYNEELARIIYASANFLLIPSLFEPCGLTQMIGFRYGTIPIARKTGGLADTIIDIDLDKQNGNGFLFTHFDLDGINYALDRALNYFINKKEILFPIIQKVMQLDFSWKKPAKEYLSLYKHLVKESQSKNSSLPKANSF